MKNKKVLVMSTLLVAIVLLGIGTIAYFRRTVNGDITGQTGNLVLIVNEANAVNNESFSVSLNRSEEEPFVLPDDKGTFDINIDSTGSSTDVDVTITISRTNLPDNLKFYLDENYTKELTTKTYMLKQSTDMTMTVLVYWFWDGSVDDENDTLFMGETLEANVSVSAMVHTPTFSETLVANSILDTNVNFGKGSSTTNGIGLMMRDGTQNDEYPIVYYRGDVSNNNVIFADLCWLIVRTTETGGIKLVFNGPVVENADGTESCTNYSGVGGVTANTNYTDVYAGNTTTAFNTSNKSPVYVGYMYNDTNKFYDTSTKVLDGTGYIAHLSDNTVDQETGRHTQNLKDSTIKGVADAWYEANILGKPEESLLEDTIWCNDRSVISETYSIENMANGTNGKFYFAAYARLYENISTTGVTPSLVCTRDMDKFTVDSANGNGDLDYPIGLLTADEINLAGHPFKSSQTTYLRLTSGGNQWSLSPGYFGHVGDYGFGVYAGSLDFNFVTSSHGARLSVSLGLGATITGGNGSFSEPYIINP